MRSLSLAVLLAGTILSLPAVAQDASPPAQVPAAANADDPLLQGFRDPPKSSRPRVWWHWMNGNISQDGITRDIDWMARIGLGGLHNFDANLATPQVVEQRLTYMNPGWQAAFRHAAAEAERHDLELAVAASAGWSETGGPWVPPADGIKKLVWAEMVVDGGAPLASALPMPPDTTGPFQNVALEDPLAAFEQREVHAPPTWYADVAVLAYPLAVAAGGPAPQARAGDAALDGAALADDSYQTGVTVPRGTAEAPGAVELRYDAPRTIRGASVFVPGVQPPFADPATSPVLEAQGPDGTWQRIVSLPAGPVPATVSFTPVTAQVFRVVFGPYDGPRRPGIGGGMAPGAAAPSFPGMGAAPADWQVTDLKLLEQPRINRFEHKAGFAVAGDYYALGLGGEGAEAGIDPASVVDLSGKLRADGTLDWTPPPGRWRIVRFGSSLTGKTNHPAPPEATGLEVDKLDGAAVRRYLETYLGTYSKAAGDDLIGDRGLTALLTDSTEVGAFNWTPRLLEKFAEARGYDPQPYLPALTGAIVGTRAASEAFLYDWRRTIAELHASEHYATVAAVAHEHGLTLYGEALEDQRPSLGDDMALRRHTDVPMAAMWTYGPEGPRPTLIGDIRGAASVAHLYGQNLVAAESLTSALSPWAHAPRDLRKVIDLEFAHGVNRPVIHTSVHQPTEQAPGLSLAIFGQYFNRHDTWAELAKPWVDYIARSSHLLQQGRFFADVAYFHGEEAPLTALYGQAELADTPRRHAWDFVNADALTGLLEVNGDGALVAPSRAEYRVLYLGGTSQRMTLPVLRRIAAMVDAGATVVGEAPTGSPSLADDPAKFAALVARLWPGGTEARIGRGRVIAGRDVEAALARIGVTPDFEHSGDANLLWAHRRLPDGDLYFITNRENRPERTDARFRVTGRLPEIWRADSGTAEPVSFRTEGAETIVPLDLAAEDSLFVVFRTPTAETARDVPPHAWRPAATLDGPWQVAFQPDRGAPAAITLDRLAPLNESDDAGVRYFSGIATYTRDFAAPAGHTPGTPLLLDLGKVGDVAEVRVNGAVAGTAWHAPWQVDIGPLVRAGDNRVEVRVANLWVNRLIGDAQPGATKVAFTTAPTYRPDAPLRPAGLIGPVRLLTGEGPGAAAR
ncbi:glycosyl hydrolase (plasmid) [Croceibacterium sp. TMG7-5b_MA50]|uniref:glycosyl hydrolase n=1 Tax=Croceibacterium sp. TMG7-5b_MA50 TaxID=3121290 RepID=UPI0032217ED1